MLTLLDLFGLFIVLSLASIVGPVLALLTCYLLLPRIVGATAQRVTQRVFAAVQGAMQE